MIYSSVAARVIYEEAQALNILRKSISEDFNILIEAILKIYPGRVVLTGIGKSGYIARKIASTLSSTGTPAFYVHPAEASHGDLGMIGKLDIVIMLSVSGETIELRHLIEYCKKHLVRIAAITQSRESVLGRNCDFILKIPKISEASRIGAPTVSTVMMLALGDAIAVTLQEIKKFDKQDFLEVHPGGKIGQELVSSCKHSG